MQLAIRLVKLVQAEVLRRVQVAGPVLHFQRLHLPSETAPAMWVGTRPVRLRTVCSAIPLVRVVWEQEQPTAPAVRATLISFLGRLRIAFATTTSFRALLQLIVLLVIQPVTTVSEYYRHSAQLVTRKRAYRHRQLKEAALV